MKRYTIIVFMVLLFGSMSCARRVVSNQATTVTVVKTRPANHKIVIVNGKRYYFWNGKHYRKTKRGYMLVRI